MFNRMTTKRIAAVALAASAIIAQAPASAEVVKHDRGFTSKLIVSSKGKAFKAKKTSKFAGHKGLHLDRRVPIKAKIVKAGFGYSPLYVAKLKRQALGVCSARLRREAYSFGYKGAKLTNANVKHVGKDKFVVYGGAKLYDGYSFGHEEYKCTVAHGKVINAYKPRKLKY